MLSEAIDITDKGLDQYILDRLGLDVAMELLNLMKTILKNKRKERPEEVLAIMKGQLRSIEKEWKKIIEEEKDRIRGTE